MDEVERMIDEGCPNVQDDDTGVAVMDDDDGVESWVN